MTETLTWSFLDCAIRCEHTVYAYANLLSKVCTVCPDNFRKDSRKIKFIDKILNMIMSQVSLHHVNVFFKDLYVAKYQEKSSVRFQFGFVDNVP